MHKPLSTLAFLLLLISTSTNADQITDLLNGKSPPKKPVENEKIIEVETTVEDDKNIQKRLKKIFTELEDFHNIKIKVSNGIVTLQGEVSSSSTKNKALQLTQQVEGVIEVEDELKITQDVEVRLKNTWKKFLSNAYEVIGNLPLFLLALVAFIVFWMIGRWLSGRHKFFQRIVSNAFIAELLGQVTHLLFILLGLLIALSILDLTAILGTLLGAAGIVGLAVGFAVRDTVENYLASILLSLRNPFEINDFVNIDGKEGNVLRLTTRATILISPDGNHIRIPNFIVFKAVIINFSRNAERRFQFDIEINGKQDLLQTQALALQTLSTVSGVLSQPESLITIEEIRDSIIKLRIYGWIDQTKSSLPKVRSEAIRQIKQAFEIANIVMPESFFQVKLLKNVENKFTLENKNEKMKLQHEAQPTNLSTQKVTDTSSDDTIEKQVEEEHAQTDTENLLNKKSSLE